LLLFSRSHGSARRFRLPCRPRRNHRG
jgi:hypothetical protein